MNITIIPDERAEVDSALMFLLQIGAIRARMNGGSPREDGTASERTMHILKWTVRGHFRNQAHGAGMKERRIQWIRPYLKGRERGNEKMPAKNTEYTVSITTP